MELPQQLTSDLRIIQHQMKLQIQTHQIMRIKQVNDPNNFKLLEDLREVEKRITSLGEKQNQLMKWVRKLLTAIPANSAIVAKTIASSFGISVNGAHPSSTTNLNNSSSNKYMTSQKKKKALSTTNDQIQNNGLKPIILNENKSTGEESAEIAIITERNKRCREEEEELKYTLTLIPENCSASRKIGKTQLIRDASELTEKQKSENNASLTEPLTAEKERFLSAVGLVTRDILKELQNKRVERKRRSTANHTQFVYGSNWDTSSKKRKKNNYLTSSAKQLVTRQAAKIPNPCSDIPTSKIETAECFKAPLPISTQCQNESANIVVNTSTSSQGNIVKERPITPSNDSEIDRICTSELSLSATYNCKQGEVCFVCQEADLNISKCSCSLHYHHSCAEIVENCIGCGEKLKSNIAERRAVKHHLQEMNNRLNSEKVELETQAAELSVTLATQAEGKKKLLSIEEDVRRKIQRIHEFVVIMKNSQSAPLS